MASSFPSRNLFQVRATRTPTPAGRRGTRGWTKAPGKSEVHCRVWWCFNPGLILISVTACAGEAGRIRWNGCLGAAEVDTSVVMVCACSLRTQQCVDECQCQMFLVLRITSVQPPLGVWLMLWCGYLLALFLLPSVGGQCLIEASLSF